MKPTRMLWLGLMLVAALLVAGCGERGQPTAQAQLSPPAVAVIAPASGTTVQKGQEVTVESQAVDDKGVTRVELWADGAVARTDASQQSAGETTFRASQVWSSEVPGSHALYVKAYDADGQASESSVIVVNVQGGTLGTPVAEVTPSDVPISQPTSEAEPTSEPTAEATAEATAEPTLEPTTPPTTAPTAKPTVKPTTAPVDKPPTIQLLSPSSPATTSPGTAITLQLKATDDKGVTRIELWADGQMYRKDEVGGGKTVNWEMEWTPSALGTYALEVKSLDTKFQRSPVVQLEVHVEQGESPIVLPPPYDQIWAEMGGIAGALGSPVGEVVSGRLSAGQEFAHGYMIWRDNATGHDKIYTIKWGSGASQDAGTWWGQFDDTWVEGDQEISCAQAVLPNGPKRGFGKVWCTSSAVRSNLGAALEVEEGFNGGWLDFENGLAIYDKRHSRAFVLLYSGSWQAVALP